MSEKTSTNREALIKITNLVRPALATQAYIPALMMIRFDGDFATTYNDISAISVRASVDVERCIPGELLIKALGSFGAEQIMFQEGPDSTMILSSGRSKIKLPTHGIKDFPFSPPDIDKDDEIELDASILKGIERCLISVGNDPTHPAQMGVTLDADDKGNAVLFSTDNFTISRYQTKSKIKLPGDSPVIMPRFFCEQLVTLAKAFPEEELYLILHDGALRVDFGKKAYLFTKTPVDLEPLDFPRVVEKQCKLSTLADRMIKIPDSFDSALGRALLVLGGEVDKTTKVIVNSETIRLSSTSPMGDADDVMKHSDDQCPEGAPSDPFYIDPALVARAAKVCSLLGFTEKVLILADDDLNFVHLVAYCAS